MSLVFNGSAWVDKLCQRVIDDCRINKRRSPRGLAHIERIELLQDRRVHHFKHEWLILWLSYKTERSILYLERSWDHESDEGWEAWVPPLIGERTVVGEGGQQKSPEYDMAMFFQEGDEEEEERRENAITLFDIRFRQDATCSQPLTLRTICEVLLDYHGKHPAYILLGANCWAWSRAVLLAVIFRADNVQHILMNKKSEPVTPEQFKMYLFTEYGAWGGMLLHVIAQRKDTDYSLARLVFMRVLLIIYPFVPFIAWLKTRLFGYLNWTLRLRRISIHEDRTNADGGVKCTYTVFPPDLTDLIPALFGRSVSPLAHSFCAPGSYLYLLTPPVAALNARILSVHIFLFGLVAPDRTRDTSPEDNADEGDTNESDVSDAWFECGILRYTEDGLSLVPEPGRHRLDVTFRPKITKNRRPYAGIHSMSSQQSLVRALRGGDMIAVWAKGHSKLDHEPAIASVKVVAQRGVGVVDLVLATDAMYALLKVIKSVSDFPWSSETVPDVKRLALRLFAYTPYFLDKFCGDWLWARISEVAKQIMWSVTPVVLPASNEDNTEMSLVDFLQSISPSSGETEGSSVSFGRATLCSLELISYDPSIQPHERLVVEVLYRDTTYVVHFEQPADIKSIKKHYMSFLWSSHGFTQDFVRIFKDGEVEKDARLTSESKSVMKAYFNDDAESLKLQDLGSMLLALKRDYWWYFWLNSRSWNWPYTAAKSLCTKAQQTIGKVEVDGNEGSLSWAEACETLKENCEGWKHADLRKYYTWKGIATGSDLRFLLREARAQYLVWYFVVGLVPMLACLRVASSSL